MKNKTITAVKIIFLFIFNAVIFTVANAFLLSAILFILLLLGLKMKYKLYNRLKTIIPVGLFIILFQIIFNNSLQFSERLLIGCIAAIRLISISLSVLLFLTYTSLLELSRLFSFLPGNSRLLFTLTCYFIPRVFDESDMISAVQKSRGAQINNWNITQNLASLIVPLIHRVFIRSEAISLSMITRGQAE